MTNNRQQGVALIMVLVIVAMVTIIATQLITERNLHARRTSNMIMADNAWQFALGAEVLAGITLVSTLKDEKNVNLSQLWATEGIIFPIDGGSMSAEIKDLRSCFNLNSILSPPKSTDKNSQPDPNKPLNGEKVFAELITLMKYEGTISAKALAARTRDWLDEDQLPSGIDGREDYEYGGYTQPYRTGDSLMGSRTELSTVSGFEPDLIALLLPYVCIIPGVTELVLNINTISIEQPELLSSFYDKLSISTAASILTARPEDGFDEAGLNKQLPAEAKLHKGAVIDYTSPYFAVTAKVALDKTRTNLKSLLHYNAQTRDIILLARLGSDD